MVIDRASARALAERWVAAWNSGDLEQVFALYHDDFEMRSPLIVERGFAPTGVLRGKAAIRPRHDHPAPHTEARDPRCLRRGSLRSLQIRTDRFAPLRTVASRRVVNPS